MADEIVRSYERTICVANHSKQDEDKYETIKVSISVKREVENSDDLTKQAVSVGKYVKKLVDEEVNIIINNLTK